MSFQEEILSKVLLEDASATVSLLNSRLTPAQIKENHWYGLSYVHSTYIKHPQWIAEARELGLLTNVWTVNEAPAMRHFLDAGVDFITTDKPELLLKVIDDTSN
jgi:glycerophosphoryl diester phosphodiesterase